MGPRNSLSSRFGHSIPLPDDTAYLSLVTGSIVYIALGSGSLSTLDKRWQRRVRRWPCCSSLRVRNFCFVIGDRGIWQHGPALLFVSVGLLSIPAIGRWSHGALLLAYIATQMEALYESLISNIQINSSAR